MKRTIGVVAIVTTAALISYAPRWVDAHAYIFCVVQAIAVVAILHFLGGSQDKEPRDTGSARSNAPTSSRSRSPARSSPHNDGDPLIISGRIRIEYQDADGGLTAREVVLHSYDPDSRLVAGRCLLRKATRHFRTDRIKHALDLSTGEVLDPTDLHIWFLNQRQSG